MMCTDWLIFLLMSLYGTASQFSQFEVHLGSNRAVRGRARQDMSESRNFKLLCDMYALRLSWLQVVILCYKLELGCNVPYYRVAILPPTLLYFLFSFSSDVLYRF